MTNKVINLKLIDMFTSHLILNNKWIEYRVQYGKDSK